MVKISEVEKASEFVAVVVEIVWLVVRTCEDTRYAAATIAAS